MNGAIYARYSSDNQREESIDAQIRAIQSWIENKGIEIAKIYVDEAKSATTDNRPQFLQMMRDAETGMFQCVIVHKLDRFSRDRFDSAYYKRHLKRFGIKLYSVLEHLDDSPESVILESVLEGMAEYYSKNLSREVMKGLKENALQCKHTGGLPPLGYDLASDKTYKINVEEAKAVKMIYTMYLNGDGYSKIIDALKDIGIKTKRGQAFGKNSLNSILSNEKYTGTYIFNRTLRVSNNGRKRNVIKSDDEVIKIPGGMPEIIPAEMFERVRQRMEIGKHASGANSAKRVYLLSGKIVCGKCGHAMIGKTGRMGRNKSIYSYYECSARKRTRSCDAKPINVDYVEEQVINSLFDNLLSPKVIDKSARKIYDAAQQTYGDLPIVLSRYEKELSKIDTSMSNIINAIADGMYDPAMKEKMEELRASKSQHEIRIAEIKSQISIHELSYEQIYDFLKEYENIKQLAKPQQKKAISLFVGKVVVNEESIDVHVLTAFTKENSASKNADTVFCDRPSRSNLIGGDGGN